MKTIRVLTIVFLSTIIYGCANLRPATTTNNGNVKEYKYFYISPTNSLTSSSGIAIGGQYYSSGKSVNPTDVITGILSKQGFIRLPELNPDLADKIVIINYGESGRRGTGLGGYTIEVTIQFVSSKTHLPVCSCTAEGQGETEADDIRKAINRCLTALFPKT